MDTGRPVIGPAIALTLALALFNGAFAGPALAGNRSSSSVSTTRGASGIAAPSNIGEGDLSGHQDVLFVAPTPRSYEIFKLNPEGREVSRLTRNSRLDDHPVWSPDRERIAYIHNITPQESQLWLMRSDGTHKRPLIELGGEANESPFRRSSPFDMSWSPDGNSLVYSTTEGISVVNTDGTGGKQLMRNDSSSPEWSPDGQKIVFSRITDGVPLIWVMNSDGSATQQLTEPAMGPDAGWPYDDGRTRADLTPTWSADGTKIAFVRTSIYIMGFYSTPTGNMDADDSTIFTIDADGGPLHQVSAGRGEYQPAYSPSGDQIVYIAHFNLYVMASDGSGSTRLKDGAAHPSW